MRNPLRGRRPTHQELMEFVDGALLPHRQKEVEFLIKNSALLQKEIALLKAIKKVVQTEMTISPSRSFTNSVMKEILPAHKESFVFRLLKNSSNVFAMVLVLSLIAFILVSPSSSSTTNPISQSLDSFSLLYGTIVKQLLNWTSQFSHPLNEAAKTSSGKLIFLALIIFSLFVVVDEIIKRKFFQMKMKNYSA